MVLRFSIVTPVYEPDLDVLRDTISSVLNQTYQDWEFILIDDNSPSQAVRDVLRQAAAKDRRITVIERPVNGHIVAASNDGLAAAHGEFIALLDHDDLLEPHALQRMSEAIEVNPEADYLYSDEDKVDNDGISYAIFRKPTWSPERLRCQMYTCHFSVIRKSVTDAIGGFRVGYEGSQDYDLVLRATELARKVVHVPEVLYHWRVVQGSTAGDPGAKPYAYDAGRRAIQDHLNRTGITGEVTMHPIYSGNYEIRRSLPSERRVSVIIPTRGQQGDTWGVNRCFVVEAVRSAIAQTSHEKLEFVVVHHTTTPASVLKTLREIAGDRLTLVPYARDWNTVQMLNVGALAAHGDRLVLLHDHVEIVSKGWLEQLVAPLEEPDVGITGAKLFNSDSSIQHAGYHISGRRYRSYASSGTEDEPGEFTVLKLNREVLAVSTACAAISSVLFREVGGISEALPEDLSDIDLSFKLSSTGYRVVHVANSRLFHFHTEGHRFQRWERTATLDRWGVSDRDPYLPQA